VLVPSSFKAAPLILDFAKQLVSTSNLVGAEQRLTELNWLPEAEKTLSEIKEIEDDIDIVKDSISYSKVSIENYDKEKSFLKANQFWLEDATDKIMQLEMLNHTIAELENKEKSIHIEVLMCKNLEKGLEADNAHILKLKLKLPTTCVLCGAPIKEGKYESSR